MTRSRILQNLMALARTQGLTLQPAGHLSPDRWVLFNMQTQRVQGFADLAAVEACLASTP